ncbi:hypothetical protein R6Q59_035739 [Mikania micrantha]
MSLRGCSSLYFIWSINDGVVEKAYNMDLRGRPNPKFKKLEEIYQHADVECTSLPLAERETKELNGYGHEENEPEFSSNESSPEELTLSQIKKKLKRKKRKASERVLLIPKAENDDFDLTEPLCKFRVKASKSSWHKRVSAIGNSSSSRGALLVTSVESKDVAIVNIKVEDSEVEYFESNCDMKRGKSDSSTNGREKCEFNEVLNECFENNHDLNIKESELSTNEGGKCEFNEVFDVEFFEINHDPKKEELESLTNEGGKCDFNEVLFDSVDDIKNMEMDCEETTSNANQPPLNLSSVGNDSFLKNPTASASGCSQSKLYLQQTPEQVDDNSIVQDSHPTIDDGHCEDLVSTEAKSPICEESKSLTSMNINADSNSLDTDEISLVSKDISILQELLSTIPANTDSFVKMDHSDQIGVMSEASEILQLERLPLTRKFISPNSQEKLCQAMKSADPLDDMEHFKCKEKLYFGEQAENTFLSTESSVEDNESNVHPQQATQSIHKKAVTSSKHVLKRPKSYNKGSPTKIGIAPKGCLDGPRLCRSLPRLSTGCTSIEGCSESAIAFSQRQMHDIESLASKLMSELNSMKVIVEEKMLYEAYRSISLKSEADEVKSAIKSATKTEETARRWLSMMARDCNRFCKIMKLNEDHNTSASGDPVLSTNQEKPLEKEKKISFADEAGGTLCDIKLYQIEQEPSLT